MGEMKFGWIDLHLLFCRGSERSDTAEDAGVGAGFGREIGWSTWGKTMGNVQRCLIRTQRV